MQKVTTDAMVTAADLMQAIEERSRGYSDATMTRLSSAELITRFPDSAGAVVLIQSSLLLRPGAV